MNFVISLAFWGILFLIATISKNFTQLGSDWYIAWLVFQVITSIVFIIFSIVSLFYHMHWFKEAAMIKNKIKRLKKEVVLNEEICKELKDFYQKYLAEEYPQFEKDIFLKIAENQPKKLIGLLESYPELKTSVVLKDMIDKTTELVENIYNKKSRIEQEIESLENIKCDNWLIWKPL
jgi:hypothetical protein